MSILFDPHKMLRKMAPAVKVERLVTRKLTLNRIVAKSLAKSGVSSRSSLERIALKVIRQYRRSYKAAVKAGEFKYVALEDALNDKKLMVQRIQNSVVSELGLQVKSKYRGEFYIWLPSSSDNPDPEHEQNYGEKFQLGVGEQPGDRPGCQCAMDILTDETELEL